jgi:hypothetical protein
MALSGVDLVNLGAMQTCAKMTVDAHWYALHPTGRTQYPLACAAEPLPATGPATIKFSLVLNLSPNDVTITLKDEPANQTTTHTITRDVNTTLANGLAAVDQCFNDFVIAAH